MLYLYTFTKKFGDFNEAARNVYRVTRNTSFTKFYELCTNNSEEELRQRIRGIKHCSLTDLENGWQVNYGTPSTKIQITVERDVTEAEVRLKSDKWMRKSSAVRDFESDGWELKETEILPDANKGEYPRYYFDLPLMATRTEAVRTAPTVIAADARVARIIASLK